MPEFFILIVEDDSNDTLLLNLAFAKAGLQGSIGFVRSGEEAMHYLLGIPPFDSRTQYPFPNLLLVDLKLPGTDGFQLLAWLRKPPFVDRGLKVAIMSGCARQQDFERARALGADFYLNKSLDFSELVAAIKDLTVVMPPVGAH